jgi:alkanesulfonate monooxygenase
VARETEEEALHDAATFGAGGAGALVGSYGQVEAQLLAYADAGITSFVLGATPALEEAWRFGEHLLPRLRARLAQERQAA